MLHLTKTAAFRGQSRDIYRVLVIPDQYQDIDTFSKQMWSQSKRGNWGEGLINTEDDPAKAERTGLLGEQAFATVFGLTPNREYIEGGDKQDFKLEGWRIDVKVQAFKSNRYFFHQGFLKRDHFVKYPKDIYVFGYVSNESRKVKMASVDLVGFATRRDMEEEGYIAAAKRLSAGHVNREIPYQCLRPMSDLLQFSASHCPPGHKAH